MEGLWVFLLMIFPGNKWVQSKRGKEEKKKVKKEKRTRDQRRPGKCVKYNESIIERTQKENWEVAFETLKVVLLGGQLEDVRRFN